MVLFFTHIPFVVNHTFNATPPERLQHHQQSCSILSSNVWEIQVFLFMFISFETLRMSSTYFESISIVKNKIFMRFSLY